MDNNLMLAFPPGVYRQGTEYTSKGRFYDADLVRWYQDSLQPIGGWRQISQGAVTGIPRAITTWADKSAQIWAGIGTHTGLWVMTQTGVLHDITPAGFTAGREDASFGGGYGSGPYGDDPYGTPRADVSVVNAASMWTLDVFDEFLIGCMAEDGVIYDWNLSTGTPAAAVSGAPSAAAVFATNDLFVMALGASGDPRGVAWCDRGDRTDWTPSVTSLAGSTRLQTNGRLKSGKRISGGELLFTTTDVHLGRYIGRPEVYVFDRLASGCGIASPNAAAVVGARCFWMTEDNFWQYNGGFAEPMPCDVRDFVFENMNLGQISKAYAVHKSAFGEVWWYYPSKDSTENDRYVLFNYREGHWNIGSLARTCGTNQDAFGRTLEVAPTGEGYEHNIGNERDGRTAYARSGPVEMGAGDRFMYAREFIPDVENGTGVSVNFYARMSPNEEEIKYGPYDCEGRCLTRFSGRQVAVEYLFPDKQAARIGVPRLQVSPGGKR